MLQEQTVRPTISKKYEIPWNKESQTCSHMVQGNLTVVNNTEPPESGVGCDPELVTLGHIGDLLCDLVK